MIFHFQKEITDKLNIAGTGNQFVSASNDRKNSFRKFKVMQLKLSQTMYWTLLKANWQFIIFYESLLSFFAKLENVNKVFLLCWPQWNLGICHAPGPP